MPPYRKLSRNQSSKNQSSQNHHTKHQHSNKLSKFSPYTKSKPKSISSKKSKQLKYKNESLIEELDGLSVDDLLYKKTINEIDNDDKGMKRDNLESRRDEENLILDIENTVNELENFLL